MAVVDRWRYRPQSASLDWLHSRLLKIQQRSGPQPIRWFALQNLSDDAVVASLRGFGVSSIRISQVRLLQRNDGKFGEHRQRRVDCSSST